MWLDVSTWSSLKPTGYQPFRTIVDQMRDDTAGGAACDASFGSDSMFLLISRVLLQSVVHGYSRPVLAVVRSRLRYAVRRWLSVELVAKKCILTLQTTIVRGCELAHDFGHLRRHQIFNLSTKTQF